MRVQDLKNCKVWKEGPKFIWQKEVKMDFSPNQKKQVTSLISYEAKQKELIDIEAPPSFTNVFVLTKLKPIKFSSWIRFVRVKAWIFRFIENLRRSKEKRKSGELSHGEMIDSKFEIIKETQKTVFSDEYRLLTKGKVVKSGSKLAILSPILDDMGLIRCNGRLQYAEYLPFDVRFPIILPKNSDVTNLIVKHFHELYDHRGTNFILTKLSTKYWIISAREIIRKCEQICFECKLRKGKPLNQIMAPLPSKRTEQPIRAFVNVGVDYGGPFLVKVGRGRSRVKRYLCLFSCSNTRAVHLELSFRLDTDSFLNSFWRFCHRRGFPQNVVSDNGSNFVGGTGELKELVSNFDVNKIIEKTAVKNVSWSFNPPLSPHFGGMFECMIKAAKKSMKKVLENADITDEELLTAITGAEFLINSRPLTYQSSNSNDVVPLTPNHFLIGQLGGDFSPECEQAGLHPVERWRRVQELITHFWKRLMVEFIPSLNPRSKWRVQQRDIRVGDVILSLSQKNERGKWPLGRVVETKLDKDNHVRRVKILVKDKIYERGLNSICLIVPSDEFSTL